MTTSLDGLNETIQDAMNAVQANLSLQRGFKEKHPLIDKTLEDLGNALGDAITEIDNNLKAGGDTGAPRSELSLVKDIFQSGRDNTAMNRFLLDQMKQAAVTIMATETDLGCAVQGVQSAVSALNVRKTLALNAIKQELTAQSVPQVATLLKNQIGAVLEQVKTLHTAINEHDKRVGEIIDHQAQLLLPPDRRDVPPAIPVPVPVLALAPAG